MQQGKVLSFQAAAAKRRLMSAIQTAVQPHLAPGEQVRRAFLAQTSPRTWRPWVRVASLFRSVNLVAIVATDRSVFVLRRRSGPRPRLRGVVEKHRRQPSTPLWFEDGVLRLGERSYWATRPSESSDARDLAAFVHGAAGFVRRPVSVIHPSS